MSGTVIRSRERIFALLSRLRDHHCLVLLYVRTGKPEPALSMLLWLDAESGKLILDAPVDTSELNLEAGHEFEVTSSLQGIDVRFRCRFDAIVDHEGSSALRVEWPEQLSYLERRKEYRVRISGGIADLAMSLEDAPDVEGELIDLSIGGFGAVVNDSPILETGEVLDCRLEFHEDSIAARAEIRRKTSSSARGRCHIGARFVRLDPRQKRMLERIVAGLERRAIRSDPTR